MVVCYSSHRELIQASMRTGVLPDRKELGVVGHCARVHVCVGVGVLCVLRCACACNCSVCTRVCVQVCARALTCTLCVCVCVCERAVCWEVGKGKTLRCEAREDREADVSRPGSSALG